MSMPTPPVPPIQPTYKDVNHLLHFALTLFTFGMWLCVWPFVWVAVTMGNKSKATKYEEALAKYTRDKAMYEQEQKTH